MPENKLHASEEGGGPEDVRHVLLAVFWSAVGHMPNVVPQDHITQSHNGYLT